MGTPPGWGLEHRASNPVSIKNLTTIETSTIVKLRPYVPVGTKRTSKYSGIEVFNRLPSSFRSLMNKRAQFKVALKSLKYTLLLSC
jgi:hypothetical protein